MTENINPSKIKELVSIYVGTIVVTESVSREFIRYEAHFEDDNPNSQNIVETSKKYLFLAEISAIEAKKLLFLLGKIASYESFSLLRKYIDHPDTKHKEWSVLCLQMLQFKVENEIYEEGKPMIMSPLSGKGTKLRYYVVIGTKSNKTLSTSDKAVVQADLDTTDKKETDVETIIFGERYVELCMLIDIDVAPQHVIDAFLDKASLKHNILRYHFFMINTHKPTEKEIDEYLNLDEVRLL